MSAPLILASASPRRRELVALLGLPLEVARPDVDETVPPNEAPAAYAQRLSREKAQAITAGRSAGIVLAADTIVVEGTDILGKPRDAAHARAMLQRLRGKRHLVLTALSVCDAATGKIITDLCETHVRMRPLSDEEIDGYIATGDPMDKAAAYAIQNAAFAPVEQVVGCPANVMGLPMCHLVKALHRQGVELPAGSPPTACRVSYGGYYCALTSIAMPGLTEQGGIPPREGA